MTNIELKAHVKKYKSIHCKPYSNLKREGLIALVKEVEAHEGKREVVPKMSVEEVEKVLMDKKAMRKPRAVKEKAPKPVKAPKEKKAKVVKEQGAKDPARVARGKRLGAFAKYKKAGGTASFADFDKTPAGKVKKERKPKAEKVPKNTIVKEKKPKEDRTGMSGADMAQYDIAKQRRDKKAIKMFQDKYPGLKN
jgi:hypothetical protein